MLESTLSHINYTYITMASKIHLVHWCYPLKKLVRPNLPAGVEGVGGGGEKEGGKKQQSLQLQRI